KTVEGENEVERIRARGRNRRWVRWLVRDEVTQLGLRQGQSGGDPGGLGQLQIGRGGHRTGGRIRGRNRDRERERHRGRHRDRIRVVDLPEERDGGRHARAVREPNVEDRARLV